MTDPTAPVADPTRPVQPSTGMVLPHVEQRSDGVLDPTFYEGLDVRSQGPIAEALPQPPQNAAEWQYQVEESGQTSPNAPQISGLSVGAITAAGAVVSWTTDKPATAQVKYGTTAGQFGSSTPLRDQGETSHSIPLTGLTPSTAYYAQVGSRDDDGNLGTAETQFTTTA